MYFGIHGQRIPDKYKEYDVYIGDDGYLRKRTRYNSDGYCEPSKDEIKPNRHGFYLTECYLDYNGKLHIEGGNTGEGDSQFYRDYYPYMRVFIGGFSCDFSLQEIFGVNYLTVGEPVTFSLDINVSQSVDEWTNPIGCFIGSRDYSYCGVSFVDRYNTYINRESSYTSQVDINDIMYHLKSGKTVTINYAKYQKSSFSGGYAPHFVFNYSATGLAYEDAVVFECDLYKNNIKVARCACYNSISNNRYLLDTDFTITNYSFLPSGSVYGEDYIKDTSWDHYSNFGYFSDFDTIVLTDIYILPYYGYYYDGNKSLGFNATLALDTTSTITKVTLPRSNFNYYTFSTWWESTWGNLTLLNYRTGDDDPDYLYATYVAYNESGEMAVLPNVQKIPKDARTGYSGVMISGMMKPEIVTDEYFDLCRNADLYVVYISENPNPTVLTYQELVDGGYLEPDPGPGPGPTPGGSVACFIKFPLNIIDPEGTITDAEDWFNNNWTSVSARQQYDYNGDYPVGTEKYNIQLSKDSNRASEATMDENYLYYPAYVYIAKETKSETGWNYNSTTYYSSQEPYITSEILTEFNRLLSLPDMRPDSVWLNGHTYYPSNINDNATSGAFDLGNLIDGEPLELARKTYYNRTDELVSMLLAGEDMTLYYCPPLSAIKEYNQTHNNENEE